MIYEAGLPLSFFEHFAVQAFFRRLRPAYKLPCRRRLSTTLHTKTRNALTPERVDKLLYIQINSRTLRRDALIDNKNENKEEENNLIIDKDEDTTFIGPVHIKEALSGQDSLKGL